MRAGRGRTPRSRRRRRVARNVLGAQVSVARDRPLGRTGPEGIVPRLSGPRRGSAAHSVLSGEGGRAHSFASVVELLPAGRSPARRLRLSGGAGSAPPWKWLKSTEPPIALGVGLSQLVSLDQPGHVRSSSAPAASSPCQSTASGSPSRPRTRLPLPASGRRADAQVVARAASRRLRNTSIADIPPASAWR